MEITNTRVLPPEEVETESETEVKDDDSEEDEKEELTSHELASQISCLDLIPLPPTWAYPITMISILTPLKA